ncbi:hypothetical protein NX059_009142 [Plenodomus lindquistii]|nr:hypothetical protein NX059_009142 [Plenodomus lindquistii]
MAALLNVPPELLEPILAQLSTSETSTLSRTCRLLHLYLSPRIYHTIDWFWEANRPAPPVHLLLRTLMMNHSLARLVKTIRMRGGGIIPESEWDRMGCEINNRNYLGSEHNEKAQSIIAIGQRVCSSLRPLEQWRAHSMITTIGRTRAHKWWIDFDRGDIDAVVSLLLHQCQAIEELDLGFGYIYYAEYVPLVFRRLMDRRKELAPYPQLQRAQLGIDGPTSPKGVELDIDLFRMFLTLPKLTYLNTMVLESLMFTWPSPSIPLHSTSLTTLIMRKSTVSEYTFAKILLATPNLKHLEYDFRRLVNCGDWNCYQDLGLEELNVNEKTEADFPFERLNAAIRAPLLSRAMIPIHQSLESLVLKTRFECDAWTMGVCDCTEWGAARTMCHLVGRIRGLENMHKLLDLEISWALLFGWWDFMLDDIVNHRTPFDHVEHDDPDDTNNQYGALWTCILPPNLERICLTDDMSDHESYPHDTLDPFVLLEKLLEVRKWECPALKQIDFFITTANEFGFIRSDGTWASRFRDMCAKVGMECRVFTNVEREVDNMTILMKEELR